MEQIVTYDNTGTPVALQGQELQDLLQDPAKLHSAILDLKRNLALLEELQRRLYPEQEPSRAAEVDRDEEWQRNEILRTLRRTGRAMSATRLHWTYLRRSIDAETVKLRCEELAKEDKIVMIVDKHSPNGRYALPSQTEPSEPTPVASLQLGDRLVDIYTITYYATDLTYVVNNDKSFVFRSNSEEYRVLEDWLQVNSRVRYDVSWEPLI